jgi:hypothetical protein
MGDEVSVGVEMRRRTVTHTLAIPIRPSDMAKNAHKTIQANLVPFSKILGDFESCIVKSVSIGGRSRNTGYFGILISIRCEQHKQNVINVASSGFLTRPVDIKKDLEPVQAHAWLPPKSKLKESIEIYVHHVSVRDENDIFKEIRDKSDAVVLSDKFRAYPLGTSAISLPMSHPVIRYMLHFQTNRVLEQILADAKKTDIQKVITPEQIKELRSKLYEQHTIKFKESHQTVLTDTYAMDPTKVAQTLQSMRKASAQSATLADIVRNLNITLSRSCPSEGCGWEFKTDSECAAVSNGALGESKYTHETVYQVEIEFVFVIEVPEAKLL